MTTLILNDVAMEAKVGERMLNVARRNAAHIGFACDSAGTCQACRCKVLEGAEQLSPPSEAERAWIPAARLEAGQRLACQTIIRGHGTIRALSWPEELRRMVLAVATPPPGQDALGNLQKVLATLARLAGDQLSHWPWNVLTAVNRVGPVRFAYPVLDEARILDDVIRTVSKMRTGVERIERPIAAASAQAGLAPRPATQGAQGPEVAEA